MNNKLFTWKEVKEKVRNEPDSWYYIGSTNGVGSSESDIYREDIYSQDIDALLKYINTNIKPQAVDGWFKHVFIENQSGSYYRLVW